MMSAVVVVVNTTTTTADILISVIVMCADFRGIIQKYQDGLSHSSLSRIQRRCSFGRRRRGTLHRAAQDLVLCLRSSSVSRQTPKRDVPVDPVSSPSFAQKEVSLAPTTTAPALEGNATPMGRAGFLLLAATTLSCLGKTCFGERETEGRL
nr:uncharacterized protein LOC113814285 [Penaeus vannamei]